MSTKVTKSNGEMYDIVIAEPCHLTEVLQIMRENFYHEEAMFKSLCSNVTITEVEKNEIDHYFDGTVIAAFAAAPCIVAINVKTSRIVGVNIITLSENPKTGNKTDGLATIFSKDESVSPLVLKYIEYLSMINEETKLFSVFPDARAMWEFYAIAIDKKHRKFGLASDLMNAGIVMSKKANVSLVFGVFTSIYSRKSAEKVGMKPMMEFDLSKYIENDSSPVFNNNERNNNIVTIMVLKIE